MSVGSALRVSVDSEFVDRKFGDKNGKPWAISTQVVWVYFVDQTGVPDKFPSKIKLLLEKDAAPYRLGEYILSPSSFYRGDYDSLQSRPTLWPVAPLAKAA